MFEDFLVPLEYYKKECFVSSLICLINITILTFSPSTKLSCGFPPACIVLTLCTVCIYMYRCSSKMILHWWMHHIRRIMFSDELPSLTLFQLAKTPVLYLNLQQQQQKSGAVHLGACLMTRLNWAGIWWKIVHVIIAYACTQKPSTHSCLDSHPLVYACAVAACIRAFGIFAMILDSYDQLFILRYIGT